MPPELPSLYLTALKVFQIFPLITPLLFLTNAPHGKFSPDSGTVSKIWLNNLTIDGTLAWILMEIPSPIALLYTYMHSPARPPLQHPASLLVALYLIHYTNRALISPLRTSSRTRSHVIIPLVAVVFNMLNGGLNGAFLGSGVIQAEGWPRPAFWGALGLWVAGFVGNILHDEVLLTIRRKARDQRGKPVYGVPYGMLFQYISYPNYLCEWVEWTGFALATSTSSGWAIPILAMPTWLFVINEICLMFPRALRGHRWYQERFREYPKDRKAIIPFIL